MNTNHQKTQNLNGLQSKQLPIQETRPIDELVAIRQELVGIKQELITSRSQLTKQVASAIVLASVLMAIAYGLFGFLFYQWQVEQTRRAFEAQAEKTRATLEKAKHDLCLQIPNDDYCKSGSMPGSPSPVNEESPTPTLISPTN